MVQFRSFRICLAVWLLLIGQVTYAQIDTTTAVALPRYALVNSCTMVGIGSLSVTDTYLSPQPYDGLSLSVLSEKIQNTSLIDNRMLLQQQLGLMAGLTRSPLKTSKEYVALLRYHLSGYYPFVEDQSYRLLGGVGWDTQLGGIYNVRNSNNPGSAKAQTNLTLQGIAFYSVNKLTFRWQIDVPVAGIFFGPNFGQSYYEMFSLNNRRQTVHFGSLHNHFAVRQLLTADLSFSGVTFRVGYQYDFRQQKAHHHTSRMNQHQLMCGVVIQSLNFGGKTLNRADYPRVYY